MRNGVRATLATASVVSVVICGVALSRQGLADPAAWATVAAALAVLAAVASAWTSQRVLELQEDALEPSLLPAIDLRSRRNLAQFTVTNHGGSHAFDVQISWDRPLPASGGTTISLGAEPIAMIPRGHSASVLIDSSHQFVAKNSDTTFTGTISFKNARGRRFSHRFTVSGEHERHAMVLATDADQLHSDVGKIRRSLEDIAKSAKRAAAG